MKKCSVIYGGQPCGELAKVRLAGDYWICDECQKITAILEKGRAGEALTGQELAEDPALQDRLFGQVRDLLETNDTLDARTTRVAKQILAAATPGELDTIEAGLRGVVQTGN